RLVEAQLELHPVARQGGHIQALQGGRQGVRGEQGRQQRQGEARKNAVHACVPLYRLAVPVVHDHDRSLSVMLRGRSSQPPSPSGTISSTSSRLGAMATTLPWLRPR